MGLVKTVQRDPQAAAELARCVQAGEPYRLLDLKIYVTRRCNLRCQMCNAWNQRGAGRGELSTAEICGVISQARALGLANLKLFGGEPLLRRDLETIIAHAAALGVRCTVITNGTLLDEARAGSLVAAGVSQLDLSLDAGDPDVHDGIRGAPDAWRRTVGGLQAVQAAARRAGRRVVLRTNTVVMRQNYRALPALVQQLAGLGVDEIALSPALAQDANARGAAPDYLLTPADILRYNHEVAPAIAGAAAAVDAGHKLARDRDKLYLFGKAEQELAAAAEGNYVARLQPACCFKPFYYAVMRENGDVIGCNTVKEPAARIGSVRTEPLARLWASERYGEFRAGCRPPRYADCRRCCYATALLNRQLGQALPAALRTPAAASAGPAAS